jgi:Zn-dependent M16 (insulinase) family peptidase
VLQENLAKAEELLHEILTTTDFNQPERIRQILLQTEMEAQQRGMMGGHMLAFKSVAAHFSAAAATQEATTGITYIQWLHKLSKEFEAEVPAFIALMEKTLARAVCRKGLILSLTEDGRSDLSAFVTRLPEGEAVADTAAYVTALPKKLGIRIPAQVSFASVGFHLDEVGMAYEGSARLLSNILSLAHLWNEVRVQGGAYGAGMRVGQPGGLFTYSFRDPNPARSLEVYRNMGEFVKGFAASGADITGFIISTVAETEPLVGPGQQGAMADSDWFAGFGYAEAVAERQQLLKADAAQLAKWCTALDALRQQASVCVVGYADALEGCKDENLTILDI